MYCVRLVNENEETTAETYIYIAAAAAARVSKLVSARGQDLRVAFCEISPVSCPILFFERVY